MPCPSHPPRLGNSNNIWWSVKVMKLLISQSSSVSLLGPNILLSTLFSHRCHTHRKRSCVSSHEANGFPILTFGLCNARCVLRRCSTLWVHGPNVTLYDTSVLTAASLVLLVQWSLNTSFYSYRPSSRPAMTAGTLLTRYTCTHLLRASVMSVR
jgi:hypothetical protein